MRIQGGLAAMAAALALGPSIASAGVQPIGPIETSLFADGSGPTTAVYGILSNSLSTASGSESTFASISYGVGGMELSATATATGGLEAVASSRGDFFFEVIGPAGLVPVTFAASGNTTATGGAVNAEAQAQVDSGLLANLVACSGTGGFGCGSVGPVFSTLVHFDVLAGHVYDVSLRATCLAASGLNSTAQCGASIDPMINIDPSFADAGRYSLAFSPSPGGVPEPESWAMMLIGLGGVGAVVRARRRVARVLA